jgi:hypothetical protein
MDPIIPEPSAVRVPRDVAPLEQGDLDGLCGVYAIIIAVRALNPHMTVAHAEELFDHFIKVLHRRLRYETFGDRGRCQPAELDGPSGDRLRVHDHRVRTSPRCRSGDGA